MTTGPLHRFALAALCAALVGTLGCGKLPAGTGTNATENPTFVQVATPREASPASTTIPNAIVWKFNGTPVPAGATVWFTSVMKVSGVDKASIVPVVVRVDPGTVELAVNGVTQTVPVPGGTVVFSPKATLATTTYDSGSNSWNTVMPFGIGGNTFLTGVALPVPAGLPGAINPVTWRASFTCSTPGVSVSWQWAAAAYGSFPTDLGTLQVKPTDDGKASSWLNSDHAGTPENYKTRVVAGATGGGGSNYTGGLSSTLVTVPTQGNTGPLSGTASIDGGKGGTLTVGRFTIKVPAGAYSGSATVGISVPDQGVMQCDLEITPASANRFLVPVTLSSNYAGASVADPSSLIEVWYDPTLEVWREVPGSTVDTTNEVVTVPLTHFSSYGVAYGRAGW